MAGYKRWGPHKPTGGLGYLPPSPGTEPNISQFRGILEDAVRRAENDPDKEDLTFADGLSAALNLYKGYFGEELRKGED